MFKILVTQKQDLTTSVHKHIERLFKRIETLSKLSQMTSVMELECGERGKSLHSG